MTSTRSIRRAQRLTMLFLAIAAGALLVASCGSGAEGEKCSSDSDCQSQLKCCVGSLGNTCKPLLNAACPPQRG